MSALAASLVMWHNGSVARRRATVDLIMDLKSDEKLVKAIDNVYQLAAKNVKFSQYADQHDSQEKKDILLVLNNHEFIALGIRKGLFDEKVYKGLQCSNVIKLWKSSASLIEEIRQAAGDKRTLFQEFEWLANRWQKKPLKVKNR